MFALSDYTYDLPPEQIAQVPVQNRSGSKLFHIDRKTRQCAHHTFGDLVSLLRSDDLLVVNNTKVIPARILGKKETGGKVEILIIDYTAGLKNLDQTGFFQCDCLVKASKHPKAGARILLGKSMQAQVMAVNGYISQIRFSGGDQFLKFLETKGQIPLPPYIKRDDTAKDLKDAHNYQTVYAEHKGAVAAPTAGLHFTQELMDQLEKKGVEVASLTLHVGYGTFVPVRVDDIRDHQIHTEYFSLSAQTADKINAAKKAGRRIVAVGTTSVRTLEYVSDENGYVVSRAGQCDLFIYPGYRFKCVDAMITNFHLPESTLLMLVSAFYDRKKILEAYTLAVEKGYRFFSYGDAMFIE